MESSYFGTGRQEILPANQYLMQRLQERRRSTRPKRARQSDIGPRRGDDDDIFMEEAETSRHRRYESSPLAGASSMGSDVGSSGYSKRRSLGVKDMDGQLDRLNKENFALKLELDHRRKQTQELQEQLEGMRAQVERAEMLEDEHKQLLEINSRLVEELEKRDKAVEEAMDIICDLEEKVTEFEERRTPTRPSTAQADSGYAGTETHEHAPLSSPPEPVKQDKIPALRPPPAAASATSKLNNVVGSITPARMRREPSFVSQKKPSTHALRSVYLEAAHTLHSVKSFNSLLSKRDGRAEEESLIGDVLQSPRLSNMSESSFPSLYSPKKQTSPEKFAWETDDEALPGNSSTHFRQDSINRVSRWMDDDDGGRDLLQQTPSKSHRVTSPLSQRTERGLASPNVPRPDEDEPYHSMSEAISAEILLPVTYNNKPCSTKAEKHRLRRSAQQSRPSSIAGHALTDQLLPPTPDSVSTRMLRESRSSITGERSLLDTTPAVVKGYNPLEPGLRTAPKQMRSSIELNSAYLNHINYQQSLGNAKDDSSSGSEDERHDARSEVVRDLSMDYDGFPDGNSILMGTPSRFLKHGKPRAAVDNMFFDGNDVSPPETAPMPDRRSTSDATLSPHKPGLKHAEISSSFLGSLGGKATTGSGTSNASGDKFASPRSHHSGSSGNRTVVQVSDETAARNRSLSPQGDSKEDQRIQSISPGRSLSQRTQKLFRRLSNSQSERTTAEHQPTPQRSPTSSKAALLPTLTSTPSSAYVNNAPPREARRQSGAVGNENRQQHHSASSTAVNSVGKQEGIRRPSLQQFRTRTEPSRPASAVPSPVEKASPILEKKGLFRRSNSSKKASSTVGVPSNTSGSATVSPSVEASSSRSGATKRRGSLREAVTSSRRPWR
jgi:hypothetical protein